MKYIYYIIFVVLIFSGLAAYGLFESNLKVSKPFISINDRIISEDEFEKMLLGKPTHMIKEQFVDSIIEKQLLIQEAVKMNINKEEDFRLSVENFYEQSLINILLKRKFDALIVDVSSDEIEKYKILSGYKFYITKHIFSTLKDARTNSNETTQKIKENFIDLSDDLKFIVMNLDQGKSSRPQLSQLGVFVYTLDKTQRIDKTQKIDKMEKYEDFNNGFEKEFNIKKVSLYIQNKKKEQQMDEWTDTIRESAEIWRKK